MSDSTTVSAFSGSTATVSGPTAAFSPESHGSVNEAAAAQRLPTPQEVVARWKSIPGTVSWSSVSAPEQSKPTGLTFDMYLANLPADQRPAAIAKREADLAARAERQAKAAGRNARYGKVLF